MKLLLIFIFFVLVYMTRLAPTESTTSRSLILSDYHEDGEVIHEDDIIFLFQPENCRSEENETNDEYDDDFQFISNFGKSYQKLLEGINKLSQTFGEILFANTSQQQYDE